MTAVQILREKLLELFENNLPFELLDEAEELEKQQIIDAISNANKSNNINVSLNPEQYYKETFNK